jgi:hypothetical protein
MKLRSGMIGNGQGVFIGAGHPEKKVSAAWHLLKM